MTESQEQLIQQAREGDREAFEEIARRYRPRLEALIRIRMGSELRARVEADDILQEVLLRAFSSIGTLRSGDDPGFFSWLAGIANHVILDQARHHRRHPSVPYEDRVEARDPSPSRGLRRSERFERLQEALDSLSPDHREVIILARLESLPISEVARRMNRNAGATAQLLWRAIKKLKERFGDTQSFHLPHRVTDERGTGHGE